MKVNNLHRILPIQCQQAFNQLSNEEKDYAFCLSKACWAGYPIILKQTSDESTEIFRAILRTVNRKPLHEVFQECKLDFQIQIKILFYFSTFLSNGGNYFYDGKKKMIPDCTKEEFIEFVSVCGKNFFSDLIDIIFDESNVMLDLQPKGKTPLYKGNLTMEEIEYANKKILEKGMMLENTRIVKENEKIIVEIASVIEKEEEYEGITFKWGWCSNNLKFVCYWLNECLKLDIVKNNENRRKMIECLIEAFTSDYTKHKEAQEWWVKDKRPIIEFNMGFIEQYKDPLGLRGDFEGMAGIVDQESSKSIDKLINNIKDIIEELPWDKEFKKETFPDVDYTNVRFFTYNASLIPVGFNLPNYSDVKEKGFKNCNIIRYDIENIENKEEEEIKEEEEKKEEQQEVKENKEIKEEQQVEEKKEEQQVEEKKEEQQEVKEQEEEKKEEIKIKRIPFQTEEYKEEGRKYFDRDRQLHTLLHELPGHGSGKLLRCDNGIKNFREDLINPLTNEPVGYYKDNETYEVIFKDIQNAMEECRADCCATYLIMTSEKVKELYEITDEFREFHLKDLIRATYIRMFDYNHEIKQWTTDHSKGAFAILKMIQKSGLYEITEEELIFHKEKIPEAIEKVKELLFTIQMCKSTADYEFMKKYFEELTTPTEEDFQMQLYVCGAPQTKSENIKRITEAELQPNIFQTRNGDYVVEEYKPHPVTIIASFVYRFPMPLQEYFDEEEIQKMKEEHEKEMRRQQEAEQHQEEEQPQETEEEKKEDETN